VLTWLIGLLDPQRQRRLGERLFGEGYHLYLCGEPCEHGRP